MKIRNKKTGQVIEVDAKTVKKLRSHPALKDRFIFPAETSPPVISEPKKKSDTDKK